MRLLVHRGQALLLLVVGGLAGAAVAAAGLEWSALPSPMAGSTTGFLAPSRNHVPARIEIGSSARPLTDRAVVAATQAAPGPALAQDVPSAVPSGQSVGQPVEPSPEATVVPATVYSYPPDDRGGRGPGGGGSGAGPGPGPGPGRGGE